MPTVFKNPYTDSVMWSLQGGLIMLSQDGGNPAISTHPADLLAATEEIQITQTRQVNTRMPLVGNTSIKIVGAPKGSCRLSTIIGPHHIVDKFLEIFGDACTPFTTYIHTVARENQICLGKIHGQKLIMKGCTGTATQFTLSTQLNLVIARGTFDIDFDTLDWLTRLNTGTDTQTVGSLG